MSAHDKHRELCELMAGWLKRPYSRGGPGCHLAVVEPRSGYDGEAPDAIGWRRSGNPLAGCYVIEVKTSRADFLADFKKSHRQGDADALGNVRFYACPRGVIQHEELPPRWGLLWVDARGRIEPVASPFATRDSEERKAQATAMWQASNVLRERFMLVGLLSRVQDPEALDRQLRQLKTDLSRSHAENARLRDDAQAVRWQHFADRQLLDALRDRVPDLYDELTTALNATN